MAVRAQDATPAKLLTWVPAAADRAAARDRALAAARNLTVFFPEARVRAVIRAAAEGTQPADSLG
jgi:hypothetical protein